MDKVRKFFALIGLLKYGIVFSALLIFLPFTAFQGVPVHGIVGNLFVELSTVGVLMAAMFLLAVAWSIMVTEGLIVNGIEVRFAGGKSSYRTRQDIQTRPAPYIPQWAHLFFSIPVTRAQFVWFTLVLGGPSLWIIVSSAQRPAAAAAAALGGFLIDYVLLILLCTPAAVLDPSDPPLSDFPLSKKIWSWFGYPRDGTPTAASRASMLVARAAQRAASLVLKRIGLLYLLDPATGLLYPAHFFAITNVLGLTVLWIVFASLAYPGRILGIASAPVAYIYASLLLFVWVFAGLNFHLGRLQISPLGALVVFAVIGYAIFGVDHDYDVRREESRLPLFTPVDVAKQSKGGGNLVVIASSGGGIWAAGWTALALERLVTARPELAHETRLLSTISGGSVGAAQFVYGLLNDQTYRQQGKLSPETLRQIRVKATGSSLEAAAYGLAFLDFPRLVSGGAYHPAQDRGRLLEREWARIAAGAVQGERLVSKGAERAGQCWGAPAKCEFLDLREGILDGSIPAVIFGATVMESGRRIMVTPVDFAPNERGQRRGQTLSEFLFTKSQSAGPAQAAAMPRANLGLWTAARLSATFSFVSPAVRANVQDKRGTEEMRTWQQHVVDGGYYDNFGITSALDWLQPVLEARLAGSGEGLKFSRVLIIQLRAFADAPPEQVKPAAGAKTALIGPLDALFAIRQGVAVSRDAIDVDRFVTYWNRQFASSNMKDVRLETVTFQPSPKRPRGPLSWHLTQTEIDNLKQSWGEGDKPGAWDGGIKRSWCVLADFLGQPGRPECANILLSR